MDMAPSQLGLHLRWESLTYDVAVATPAAATGALEPAAAAEEGTAARTAAAQGAAPQMPQNAKRILHAVSGQVLPGQLLAVAGPSGSGA